LLKLKERIASLTLVPGVGGAFEITVNGRMIFSKKQTGHFPDPDAVVKQVRAMR